MRARALAVALVGTASLAVAPTAWAGTPPQHLEMSYDEAPVVSDLQGLGPGCDGLVGTLTESRHLDLRGWIAADGAAHATATVSATVTVTPTAPGGVMWSGSYVQHQAGRYADFGTRDLVVTTTTHGTLSGSDGEQVRIQETVHLTVRADGSVAVVFDDLRCRPA